MPKPKMEQLAEFGQSVWLDYISRPLLETGQLQELIDSGLRGMTSNPSIFNQAIGNSQDYDEAIADLKREGKSAQEIYDELTIKDIQQAADIFLPVYKKTQGLDGYVSLEINPLLAEKVEEQIKEGVRLFEKVNRPNVMIKVPATKEGFSVFEELIARSINVNVTLIFALEQYIQTVQSYWKGLERLGADNGDLSKVRSVASVFVSRIDTTVDQQLEELLANEEHPQKAEKIQELKGKAAVANSRLIFEKYKELFYSPAFEELQKKGANIQRVLWGSTSTKNPAYSDIKYVEELIVQPTVNTIPEKTLKAYIDHGEIKDAFISDVKDSESAIAALKDLGIIVDHVCYDLLRDGVDAFDDAFESLISSIEKKAAQLAVS